ncbi:MAG: rhomboid family intramembrane serine protease [Thermogemmata sp.]|nr:rhomboid family intramembrane serine protease [Thermogemmata sp.]
MSAAPNAVPPSGGGVPGPKELLAAIAASGEQPWFPSAYVAATGVPRDALDDPLTDLRLAGLIEVVTWVKGRGQGYRLTPAGRQALQGSVAATPPLPDATTTQSSDKLPLNLQPLVMVWVLAGACLLVFLGGLAVATLTGNSLRDYLTGQDVRTVHRLGGIRGSDLLQGQWYRLLTANFVHFGLLHLLANGVALVLLGAEIETVYGRWQLLWLFLISGVGGVSAAVATTPEVVLAGASAAIWGLLTAEVVWLIAYRRQLSPTLFHRAFLHLASILLLNVLLSLVPGISWAGHMGGGVWGMVAACWLLLERQVRYGRWRALILTGRLGLLLVPVLVLLAWMEWGPGWEGMRQWQQQERQRRRLWAAQEQFNHQVLPRLGRLQPQEIESLQRKALLQLLRPAARRDSATVAHLHEQLRQRLDDAQMIQELLQESPTGHAPFDRYRQQVVHYVALAQHLLQILDVMLEEPDIPTEAAWYHWGRLRQQLDQAWLALQPP